VITATRATKRLRRKEQQWRPQPTAAITGAGNGGRSGGSARADNNQPNIGSKDVQNITLNVLF